MTIRVNTLATIAAAFGLVCSPASADNSQNLLSARLDQNELRPAVGASLSLGIPIGRRTARSADQVPALEMRIGLHLAGSHAADFQVSPVVSYRWKPKVSTELSVVGQIIAARYSLSGTADTTQNRSKLGISSWGAVGLGLGVLALAGVIRYASACKSETDNRPSCSD